MKYEETAFGRSKDGSEVTAIKIFNENGMTATVISYGATLISVTMPDKHGDEGEITLGFDSIDGYLNRHPYFGSTVGRYANRISKAKFFLDGNEYSLYKNDGNNHLHGGQNGFDRQIWHYKISSKQSEITVTFSRTSEDGEEGYPGNVDVSVSFTLTDSNDIVFEYRAETDKPTPVNLTNHTYWNLAGPGKSVLNHTLKLYAQSYLSIDNELIPDGAINGVTQSPFDFTVEKAFGTDIDRTDGYDHCFILNSADEIKPAALVEDPASGRVMEISTTQPAIQLYTANMLEKTVGRDGIVYDKHGAFCLETGGYNNAVNIPDFPQAILNPGEIYREMTKHHFHVP
jgi:aldose 1-epimerase